MREDHNTADSLWLYRVARDPDLLNRPPERISSTQAQRASLPVRLYYLVTPLVPKPEDRQTLIGRVVQLLNDHTQCTVRTFKTRSPAVAISSEWSWKL